MWIYMNLHTYNLKNTSQNLCILRVSSQFFNICYCSIAPSLCSQINIITDADPQTHIFKTKLVLDFLYELHFLGIFSLPPLSSACDKLPLPWGREIQGPLTGWSQLETKDLSSQIRVRPHFRFGSEI